MSKEFSPKLQEHFESHASYIKEGEIWRIFDCLYGFYKNMFAEHIIKITWWEQWAIDICNERLANGNKTSKIIWLENKLWEKIRKAVLKSTNDNNNSCWDLR